MRAAPWLSSRQTAALVATLVAAGLMFLVFADTNNWPRKWQIVGNAMEMGTFSAFNVAAAAWLPLGSGTMARRLLLSAGIHLASIVSVAFNIVLHAPPAAAWQIAASVVGMLMIVIAGLSLLTQGPLWNLATTYRLCIQRTGQCMDSHDESLSQFGLRQLMIVMAAIAIVLGLGRAALLAFADSEWAQHGSTFKTLVTIAFVVVANVIVVLPLFLSSLLARAAVPATLVALFLCGVATVAEIPLFAMTKNLAAAGDAEIWFIVAMNTIQAAWILAFTGVLRLGGYRLTTATASGDSP